MLRSLFLDMNAFFASAEQHCHPRYRGRPLVVAPVDTDSTSCVAVSYEARPFGIRTGTNVSEARRLCPGLIVVSSRTDYYVRLHHQIIEAVERVIPVTQVWSIDEMVCRLWSEDRPPEAARALAMQVKASICDHVGPTLKCSVGLAPNPWLAKVASDMQKPDGLTMILEEELPDRLFPLELRDLPGVGQNMEKRLQAAGIFTVRELCSRTESELDRAWGSVVGARWWHQLRGEQVDPVPTRTQSIGHEHVLPPAQRTASGAHGVLTNLIHKAATRARQVGYRAGKLTFEVRFVGTGEWRATTRMSPQTHDTLSLVRAFERLWADRPSDVNRYRIIKVSVTLQELRAEHSVPASLFAEDRDLNTLSAAMDSINRKFGRHALILGGMHDTRDAAPDRIAFHSIPTLEPERPASLPAEIRSRSFGY
jgi:DNA polymerase-4